MQTKIHIIAIISEFLEDSLRVLTVGRHNIAVTSNIVSIFLITRKMIRFNRKMRIHVIQKFLQCISLLIQLNQALVHINKG